MAPCTFGDVRDYSHMVGSPAIAEAERRRLRVLGTLNEYQARLFVAHRALEIGRGGISRLSQMTGMARPTITKGIAALRGRAPSLPRPPDGFDGPGVAGGRSRRWSQRFGGTSAASWKRPRPAIR